MQFSFRIVLWRRIQAEGLAQDYKKRSNKKLSQNNFFLAFIHICEVKITFEKHSSIIKDLGDKRIIAFRKYFLKQFIDELAETTLDPYSPKYEIEFWSCFDRIKECVARTTNVSETFHKTINHNSGMTPPNLARFCNLLWDAEENARVQLLQIEAVK
ncbi:hypothetical protein CDIK_4560 [Cucumispora dikerogammari]|nr:hypothetical protein CDIK_4560 [Cucumispora dikerogammari]